MVENIAVSPKGDSAWYEVTQSGMVVFVPSQAAQIEKSIVRLASGAEPPSPLLSAQAAYSNVRFSPDGKRLLIGWDQNRITDIWVDDLAKDALTSNFTFGSVVAIDPRVESPMAATPLPLHSRGGRGDGIAVARTDGAGEMTQLLDGRPAMGGYSISPDGKTIVYAERGGDTGQDLWTLPIDLTGAVPKATGQPQVFLRTPKDETNPAVSPDGRWLAYVSNESGQNEVYVRPFPGGHDAAAGKRLASIGGGRAPVWSPNHHDLFYRNVNRQIMMTPYSISGDTFSVEKPRLWSPAAVVDFDVAPDGKSVAAIVDPPAGAGKSASVEAVFLLNFFDELKRRLPPK